jgi:ankyrin repeat protein
MDVFDLLAKGQLADLGAALETDPSLASARHASGASLLAWAHYVGQPAAAALIRPRLGDLDPHDAIVMGEVDRLQIAIAGGWDPNTLSPDGFTPLGLAAFFNRPEVFDLLLPLTADVNQPADNAQKVAAIHAAATTRNAAMVEKLLRAGARPDQTQADGFTPLHVAAQHGDGPVAALLLLFGADPYLRNNKAMDATDHARAGGHGWLAERLAAIRPH